MARSVFTAVAANPVRHGAHIEFDVVVWRKVDGSFQDKDETWALVSGDHRSVLIRGNDLLAIDEDPALINSAQRRKAIRELLIAKILPFGIHESDDAMSVIAGLYSDPAEPEGALKPEFYDLDALPIAVRITEDD